MRLQKQLWAVELWTSFVCMFLQGLNGMEVQEVRVRLKSPLLMSYYSCRLRAVVPSSSVIAGAPYYVRGIQHRMSSSLALCTKYPYAVVLFAVRT